MGFKIDDVMEMSFKGGNLESINGIKISESDLSEEENKLILTGAERLVIRGNTYKKIDDSAYLSEDSLVCRDIKYQVIF